MSFVSIDFGILLIVLLFLFLIVHSAFWRKVILLTASCFFYAYWDWRFLGLLIFITCLDYYISYFLAETKNQRTRKLLLIISIVTNLGFLGFFKYFNFFIDSLDLLLPVSWQLKNLAIILPIGISFYTFETLSYVIDVYNNVTRPAKSLLDYAIFITFFPRLVAGPIMRARQFLPQLEHGIRLNLDNLVNGSQLFLRGMIKKLVIADNLASMADQVFAFPGVFSPLTVWLGVFAYSIQILCDFSGYTDMALGIAKMIGFELPVNFNLPYTAQSITEFWQRWHISLSTWLRDYLYINLGGNRKGRLRTYLNLMITMLLGGLWHGASWNFVLWGGLHGTYLAFERRISADRKPASWVSPIAWLRALWTFLLVSFTWIFFRSPSMRITAQIFVKLLFIDRQGVNWTFAPAIVAIPIIVLGGFLSRQINLWAPMISIKKSYVWAFLLVEILFVYYFSPSRVSPFIYFQF